MVLLLLAPEFQERRPEHRNPEARQRRPRSKTLHLLLEHSALGCGQAAPAIFTRPFRHCPGAPPRAANPPPPRHIPAAIPPLPSRPPPSPQASGAGRPIGMSNFARPNR